MFGEVYRWSQDEEFMVMFVAVTANGNGWTGPIINRSSDGTYQEGEFDDWVGEGVTIDKGQSILYWEKVDDHP